MELEEMKSLWADLSLQVEKQDKIQKRILMDITKKNFQNRIWSIALPEILSAAICFAYSGYMFFKLPDLVSEINQILSLVTILILILLPILSLSSIHKLHTQELGQESPGELLRKFARNKARFWKIQKLSLWMSGVLVIALFPPLAEFAGKTDLIMSSYFWFAYVPAGLLFFFFFSRWVLKGYKKAIIDSEELIKSIEQ